MGNSGVTRSVCLSVECCNVMRHSNVKSECQLKQIKLQSVGNGRHADPTPHPALMALP